MESFAHRLADIQSRIADAAARAGRSAESVTLVAVSKTKPVEALHEAVAAGVRVFGENRVQEAVAKMPHFERDDVQWHLIGHLQSNKSKLAVERFAMIQSVDSLSLAVRLSRLAAGMRAPILLQVQLGDEETKSGAEPEDVPEIVRQTLELPNLTLRGLMAIPPYFANPEDARPFFRRLRELRDALQERFPAHPLPELSMGMSHDFEVAIEEGATMVRVGTALFGTRG
jgi:pyridoxal phosphate enzyme (YggS family)